MSDKLKLLFLSANPAGSGGRLRTDVEIRDVHQQIAASLDRKHFEITSYFAVRTTDLTRTLLDNPPHILHFSGHCGEDDGIYLEDALGRPAPVSGEALAGLFAVFKGTLKIVFLNACESRATGDAFRHLVEYTIVMKRRVSDRAAIVFATAFYQALARRQPVPSAFQLAVNQLLIERLPEVDTPELLKGIPPIEVKPAAPQPRPPKKEPPQHGDVENWKFNNSSVRDIYHNKKG